MKIYIQTFIVVFTFSFIFFQFSSSFKLEFLLVSVWNSAVLALCFVSGTLIAEKGNRNSIKNFVNKMSAKFKV